MLILKIAITRIYLSAARLHLHAFYLFDDTAIDGYTDRIVTLYQTACSLIQHCLDLDSQENSFFNHCPFFLCQVFVCASFVVLKILNSQVQSLLDLDAGNVLLNAAISALRKMSIANNDLPARLSDVIGFFCSLPGLRVVGGQEATNDDGLQLRVRNRLSMSIVYDSLWEWRKHFQTNQGLDTSRTNVEDKYSTVYVAHGNFVAPLLTSTLHSMFSASSFPNALSFDQMGSLADMLDFEWSYDVANMQ